MGKAIGAVSSGGLSLAPSLLNSVGLGKSSDAGRLESQMSQEMYEKALKEIENLEIPDIEKEKLQLQLQSEAGFLDAEELADSALGAIEIDPRMQQAQMQALSDLKERAEMGLTPEDMALMDRLTDQEAARSQAEQAAILQGMAERGTMDSGMQLAAQLSAQQGAANRGQDRAMQKAGQSFAARQNAIQNLGNMGMQMSAQDFGQQAQQASAADRIAQFNAMNRQDVNKTNLGIRQSDVATQNQEQMFNKGLIDRDFNRRMDKAQAMSGQFRNRGQDLAQAATANAQADAAKRAGRLGIATGIAGKLIGGA